ncbi:zinc finger protein 37 isoform X5 [Biomphalaria glabrata]|nr:zinc finger protein 37 isoform X5 [Biomphalaria glabrata]
MKIHILYMIKHYRLKQKAFTIWKNYFGITKSCYFWQTGNFFRLRLLTKWRCYLHLIRFKYLSFHPCNLRTYFRMPEFQQLDVTVANRFISSLSKSLQALCHGCMDFDTGIEIVGYINVSIDCGRKVDYVLNERVLKSNTNSMTFVSNSFLAKKEQIKQTRDGSCSPVSEFTTSTPYPRPFRSSYQASHQSTSSFSQSYVLRGSQKRAMERDWRAPKRLRGERSQYSETVSSAQTASYSNLPGDSFKMPQSQNSSNATEDSQINIKQEVLENESERNESDNAEQTSDYKSNEPLSAADIKKDPDSCALPSEDTSQADDSTEPEAEFKGTFLQPSTSELTDETSVTDKQSTTAKLPETSELNKPSSSKCTDDVADDTHGESAHGESMAPASEMHLDYEEEEGNYPQSVYSDAGEGSSDTGQFEVIEIDDEDEDVQAMFAESQEYYRQTDTSLKHQHSATKNLNNESHGRFINKYSSSHRNSDLNSSALGPPKLDSISVLHKLGCLYDKGSRRKYSSKRRRQLKSALHLPLVISQHASTDETFSQFPFRERGKVLNDQTDYCTLCNCTLPFGVTYQFHFNEVHASGSLVGLFSGSDCLTCNICCKSFVTKERLRQHSSVHDTIVYSCHICNVKFKHKKNIGRHLETSHGLKKCMYCNGLFRKGDDFNFHILDCDASKEGTSL